MVAPVTKLPSMNEASDSDPFNNNCYGTLVDRAYKIVNLPVLDVHDFNERIIRGYEEGYAEKDLPADLSLARSLVPAGTATLRDFSNISPEIPEYIPETAPAAWTASPSAPIPPSSARSCPRRNGRRRSPDYPEVDRAMFRTEWSKTNKYYDGRQEEGQRGGMFQIIIDPRKCKGCAECVTVCDDDALKMIAKTDDIITQLRKSHRYFKDFGPSTRSTSTTTC